MIYPESIGFANCAFDDKPTKRKTCRLIGNYIIKYIFYNYTDNFEELANKFYKIILDSAIYELENVGYLTLKRLGEIVDDQIKGVNEKFSLWFQ